MAWLPRGVVFAVLKAGRVSLTGPCEVCMNLSREVGTPFEREGRPWVPCATCGTPFALRNERFIWMRLADVPEAAGSGAP